MIDRHKAASRSSSAWPSPNRSGSPPVKEAVVVYSDRGKRFVHEVGTAAAPIPACVLRAESDGALWLKPDGALPTAAEVEALINRKTLRRSFDPAWFEVERAWFVRQPSRRITLETVLLRIVQPILVARAGTKDAPAYVRRRTRRPDRRAG